MGYYALIEPKIYPPIKIRIIENIIIPPSYHNLLINAI